MFEDLLISCRAFGARVALVAGTTNSAKIEGEEIACFRAPQCRRTSLATKFLSWVMFCAYTARHIVRDRNSHYVITSNPPLLLPTLAILRVFLKISYSLLIYDIYPDALERMGYIRVSGYIANAWRRLCHVAMANATTVYTISPCLRKTLTERALLDRKELKIKVFPTWVNTESLSPQPRRCNSLRASLGLLDHFVVTYAGNLSPTQDLGVILQVADRMRDLNKIAFVFIGDGSERVSLESTAAALSLRNVHFLQRQPEHLLNAVLTLGDCTFVSIGANFRGISMPSKLYPALAAGNPILAVTPPDTYLESVVAEHNCGIIVRPGDAAQAAAAVLELYNAPAVAREMASNAREVAENYFSHLVIPRKLATDLLIGIPRQGNKTDTVAAVGR